MSSEKDESKEYTVSVRTDDIHEAIGAVADALYTLVEEALAAHENHEAEECEFETFARDVLGVLSRHADQLPEGPVSWDDNDEASNPLYE